MYKWHVHSSISAGRPLGKDFARAADGIAASLRHFHVSRSRSAADEDRPPRSSRAERSAAAAAEISSLAPSHGVDARSLAAKPSPSLVIRRLVVSSGKEDQGRREGFSRRGASNGFRGRGRGGLTGRGRGGARGRGRGAAGRGGRSRRTSSDEDVVVSTKKLTPEEQEYQDATERGVPTSAVVGLTNREDLELEVPAVATINAPIGLVETLRERMRTIAGLHGNERPISLVHSNQYHAGNGTLFLHDEHKADVIGSLRHHGASRHYDTIHGDEQTAMLQTFVAGQYQAPSPMVKGDTLGLIGTYARKNESYLPEDGELLKSKVKALLPTPSAAKPRLKAAARQ